MSQTHALVIVTRSIDKSLCNNVRMGPRSYSHVCLLSHPSTVPSRHPQLLACPRHRDGALQYMADASSSIVVEMGVLTVEHSSGQQPFSRVFYAPPGTTLWLHRSYPVSAIIVFQLFGRRLGGRLLTVDSNVLLHERVVGFARHAVGRKSQSRQTPSHRSRALLWRLPLSRRQHARSSGTKSMRPPFGRIASGRRI